MYSKEMQPYDIFKQIGDFDKIDNIAKRAARMGQNFSSSMNIPLDRKVTINIVDDITNKAYLK